MQSNQISTTLQRDELCLDLQTDSTKNQMHGAIQRGDLAHVKRLIQLYKIQPNEECSVRGYFWTALHYACHFDSVECLEFLIKYTYSQNKDKYIDIMNLKTREGWTPLMIASIYGKRNSLITLLNYGGLKLFETDKEGKKAIELALKYKFIDIAKILKKQMDAYSKDAPADTVTPINVTALTTSSEMTDLTKQLDAIAIESKDEYKELLKFGKRLPCLICTGNNGWIKYTKCCGQPLHPLCRKKLTKCPNCTMEGLTLIADVLYPERAYTLDEKID